MAGGLGCGLLDVCFGLWVVLWVVSCGLWVVGCGLVEKREVPDIYGKWNFFVFSTRASVRDFMEAMADANKA